VDESILAEEKGTGLTEAAKEALRREVPIIEASLRRLRAVCDDSSTECLCCHLKVKRSWRDAQLVDTVKSILNKLSRWEQEAGGRKL
jgi:hypothetical protein